MIARLQGEIWEKEFSRLVVNVHGVGYELLIPMSTYDQLGGEGDNVDIYVYTQVREDAITLFGFASIQEKRLFEALLGVSGVGGKLALSILSGLPVDNFCRAVAEKNIAALSKISGIGKRTAERIVVELNGKLEAVSAVAGLPSSSAPKLPDGVDANAISDAVLALVRLGYKQDAATAALHEIAATVPPEETNSSNLLRLGLQKLNS